MIKSHKSKTGIPSNLTPASSAITSDSVDECDTAPCFLHSHVSGQKVLGPTMQSMTPVVDLLSVKSPAKLASQNNMTLQSLASSPTKLVITLSAVWWI